MTGSAHSGGSLLSVRVPAPSPLCPRSPKTVDRRFTWKNLMMRCRVPGVPGFGGREPGTVAEHLR